MALIELNRNPSRRELMTFGAIFALFFAAVGALLRWKFGAPAAAAAVWSAAGLITVAFILLPPTRRPLYLGMAGLGWPIGWVVSHVAMAFIYYVVFMLTGLALRVTGRDPMRRRLDAQAQSYWVEHRAGGDRARYFRQF